MDFPTYKCMHELMSFENVRKKTRWVKTWNEKNKRQSGKGAMRHHHANNFTMKRKEKKKRSGMNETRQSRQCELIHFDNVQCDQKVIFLRTHDVMPPPDLIFMFFMWLISHGLHYIFFMFCCQFSQLEHKCFETMCNFTKKSKQSFYTWS